MPAPKGNKFAEGMGGGRPTKFKPEYVEKAQKLCRLGATDIELADFFEVTRETIWRWSQAHEEFCNALKVGKAEADERVERSLYAKAVGYTFDSVKIFQDKGEPVIVPYREHVPPDATAALFWLKNRRPAEWRELSRQEHTGKDGAPIETSQTVNLDGLTKAERDAIRPILERIAGRSEGSGGGSKGS